MDLYSAVYDATDPSDLGQSDAWQVRLAMVGKDLDTRHGGDAAAMGVREGPHGERGDHGHLLARAASRVAPDADLQADAPEPHRLHAGRRLRPPGRPLGQAQFAAWTTTTPTNAGRCLR